MFCKAIFGSSLGAMVKKEITSDQNWIEAFWETAFRCVNATHRVTRLSSVFSLLTQFSGNLQWDISERNEACGDKGNILRWKLERSFVRNFLVMCEFISQSYSLDLRKQFANTLFVECAKWYLGAYWGPWWQRKYPHIITKEKLSEKLHCHVWMQLTELQDSLQWLVC